MLFFTGVVGGDEFLLAEGVVDERGVLGDGYVRCLEVDGIELAEDCWWRWRLVWGGREEGRD